MKIFIDGDSSLVECEPTDKLGQILDEIEIWMRSNGRAMMEIKLDENIVDAAKRNAFVEEEVSQFNELHILSVDIKDLAFSIIEELKSHLPNFQEVLSTLGENVQAGNIQKSFGEDFNAAISFWEAFYSAIVNISGLTILPLDSIEVGSTNIQNIFNNISNSWREANEALQNQDIVTLGDIIEYELRVQCDKLSEIIDMLAESVKSVDITQITKMAGHDVEDVRSKLDTSIDVIIDKVKSFPDTLEKIIEMLDGDAADDEKMSCLQNVFSFWDSTIVAVDSYAKINNINWQELKIDDLVAQKQIEKLQKNLKELRTASSNKDYVAAIDIMEYEFKPAITKWQTIIERIKQTANKRGD